MGLVYKLFTFFLVWLFCWPALADDKRHSLSVGWASIEDSVSGQGRTLTLDPKGVSLSYAYQYSETASFSLSYKAPQVDESLGQNLQLSRDSSSYSASVSYLLGGDVSFSAAYFLQEKDTEVWVTTNQNRYLENFEVEEIELFLSKDWFYGDFAFTPSIAFAYQQSQLDLSQNFLFRERVDGRLIPISTNEIEKDSGLYSTAAIDMAALLSLSESVLFIPSISVSWIEPLVGDISSTSSARAFNQSRTVVATTQDDYEALSGQGGCGFGGLFVIGDYSFGGTYSRAWSTDESQPAWELSLGIDF